jgi:hypothetical protein
MMSSMVLACSGAARTDASYLHGKKCLSVGQGQEEIKGASCRNHGGGAARDQTGRAGVYTLHGLAQPAWPRCSLLLPEAADWWGEGRHSWPGSKAVEHTANQVWRAADQDASLEGI